MHNSKSFFLSVTALALAVGILGAPLTSAKDSQLPSNKEAQESLLSRIYVNDVTVTSNENNTISGYFTARNSEKVTVSDLQYQLILLDPLLVDTTNKLVQDNASIYDRVTPTETFTLNPGESKKIPFTYQAPSVQTGTYRLRVQIATTNDRNLGWNDANVSLIGGNSFALMHTVGVDVKSTDPITQQTLTQWGPKAGPNVNSGTVVTLKATLENNGASAVNGTLQISEKRLLSKDETVNHWNAMQVTVQPGKTADISIPVTAQMKPGAYVLFATLLDEHGKKVSGVGEFRYVVNGVSASIATQTVKTIPTIEGQSAEIHAVVAGSADRMTPVNGILSMTITDDQGVAAHVESPLHIANVIPAIVTAQAILTRNLCGVPHVTMSVTDDKGVVLATYDVPVPTQKAVVCVPAGIISKQGVTPGVILFLMGLIFLFAGSTLAARKQKGMFASHSFLIRASQFVIFAAFVTSTGLATFIGLPIFAGANGIQQIIYDGQSDPSKPNESALPQLFVNSPQHDITVTSNVVQYSARYSWINCGNDPAQGFINVSEKITGGKVSDAGNAADWKLLGTNSFSQGSTCFRCDDRTRVGVDLTGTFTLPSLTQYQHTTLWTVGNSMGSWKGSIVYDFTWLNMPPPSTDVSITKTGPSNLTNDTDSNYSYSIVVRNNGSTPAQGVQMRDTLPNEVTLASTPSGCVPSPGSHPTVLTCALNTLAPNSTITIPVNVTAPARTVCDKTITNNASVSTTTQDTNSQNDQASAQTHFTCTAQQTDIQIVKTTSTPTVHPGDTVTFSLSVTNNGSTPAQNVVVNDTRPAGLNFVDSDSRCSGGNDTLTCNLGTLAPGQTITLQTHYSAYSATSPACSIPSYTNTATVTTTTQETNQSNNTSSVTVQCAGTSNPTTDVSITKTAPSSVNRGDALPYTLVIRNIGNSNADNVVINDPIPTGLTYVSANGATCAQALPSGGAFNGFITCNLGSMNAGSSKTVTLTFQTSGQTTCGTVTNTASVTTNSQDSNGGNNQSSAQTQVQCPVQQNADLQIIKTASSPTAHPGDTVTFSLKVTNLGSTAAQNVVIDDVRPAGMNFVDSDSRCSGGNDTLHCNLGTINAGQSITIQSRYSAYSATSPDCSIPNYTNTATVSTSTNETNLANNTSSVTVQCVPTAQNPNADLQIQKTTSTPSVHAGDTVTFSLKVTNIGSSAAQNVVIDDVRPAGLNYIDSDSRCSVVNDALRCNLGTINAGQSITIQARYSAYSATSPDCSIPNYTNTATVSTSTNETNLNNNTSSVTVQCVPTAQNPNADLQIQKTTSTPSVHAGDTVTFSLKVTNIGSSAAQNVVIDDVRPAGLNYIDSDSRCSVVNDALRCNLGTINAGQSITIQARYSAYSATSPDCSIPNYTNTATVSTSTNETNLNNNTSSVTVQCTGTTQQYGCINISKHVIDANGNAIATVPSFQFKLDGTTPTSNDSAGNAHYTNVTVGTHTVSEMGVSGWTLTNVSPSNGTVSVAAGSNCANVTFTNQQNPQQVSADVAIQKTGDATVLANGTVHYTIVARNNGPDSAQNVIVTDPIPSGLTYLQANSDVRCVQQGSNVLCSLGTMVNGQAISLALNFTVQSTVACNTQIVNNATIATSTPDSNLGNNQASATTQVQCITQQYGCINIIKQAYNAQGTPLSPTPSFVFNVDNTQSAVNDSTGHTPSINNVAVGQHVVTEVVPQGWTQTSVSPANGLVNVFGSVNNQTCTTVIFQNQQNSSSSSASSMDLSITKTANPSVVSVGSTTVFTITVYNSGPTSAQNVVVNDSLPSGLSFVSAVVTTGNFSGSQWNIGTLQSGGSATLQMTATMNVSNSVTNTATVTSTTQESNYGNNSASATVTGSQQNGCIDIYKTAVDNNGNSISYIPSFTFSLDGNRTVTNDGSGHARFDNVPNGSHTVTEYGIGGWNQVSISPNNGYVNVNGGGCATVNVRNQQNGNNNNNTNLTITKTDGRSTVSAGDHLTYTITVRNNNGSNANNVTVTDTLPNDLRATNASDNGYITGSFVRWNNVYVGAYSSKIFTLDADVSDSPNSNTLTNRAEVTGGAIAFDTDTIDQTTGTNTLELTKTASTSEVFPGGIIEYTVTLRNSGNGTMRNIRVTDTLPTNVTVTDNGGADTNSNTQLTWRIDNLSHNATRTIRYRITIGSSYVPGSIVRNDVRATADGGIDERASTTVQVIGNLPQTGFMNGNLGASLFLKPIVGQTITNNSSTGSSASMPLYVWLAVAGMVTGTGAGFARKFILGA